MLDIVDTCICVRRRTFFIEKYSHLRQKTFSVKKNVSVLDTEHPCKEKFVLL